MAGLHRVSCRIRRRGLFLSAVIPDTKDVKIPEDAPVGMKLILQKLAFDLFTSRGNFSNPVELTIR